MAIWIGDCPHCGATKMTFTTCTVDALGDYYGNAFFSCPGCRWPVAVTFGKLPAGRVAGAAPLAPKVSARDLHGSWKQTIEAAGYVIVRISPPPVQSAAPDAVPQAIARNFIQAEEARKRMHREAAGMAYRRVLELALKDLAPEQKGTLEKRIEKLAEAGRLTPDLATWAHSVRQLGNEAAHDEPEPSEEDIDDLGGFTRVVLEYLYTMPAKVRRRATEMEAAAAENAE